MPWPLQIWQHQFGLFHRNCAWDGSTDYESLVVLQHLLYILQYNVSFYLQYLARWPEYCLIGESIGLQKVAYSEWRRLLQYLKLRLWHDYYIHCILAVLGKVEGEGRSWHGHVTAVTVCPTYRRQRIAQKLMDILEDVTANRLEQLMIWWASVSPVRTIVYRVWVIIGLVLNCRHDGYFVDLFVRASNKAAISMYQTVRKLFI